MTLDCTEGGTSQDQYWLRCNSCGLESRAVFGDEAEALWPALKAEGWKRGLDELGLFVRHYCPNCEPAPSPAAPEAKP